MDPSLASRRLHVLVLAAGLLLIGAYAGFEARGGVDAVLRWNLLTGEPMRVEVDASVGRTDAEQLTQDLIRVSDGLQAFQVQQARNALIAMGVEGAATMPEEEILRRIRDAQVQAIRGFSGRAGALPPEADGLREMR